MHSKYNFSCIVVMLVLSIVNFGAQAVTYDFENIGNGNSSFVSSGQTFTVSPELIGVSFATYGSEIIGGADVSDGYLDTGFQTANSGNVGGINAPSGQTFKALQFDVWPSANEGGLVLPAGTLVRVLGIRSGMSNISVDVATADFGQPTAENVRWARIDLTGTVFNSTDIESVQFQLIGSQNYIAVDNFIYTDLQAANTLPTIGGTSNNQAVDDDQTILLFQNVTLSEADGDDVSITISLDNNAKGVFTPASLSASGFTGTGPYSLSSRAASAAQTAIRLLDFNPSDDRVAPGQTETTTFNVASSDGVGTANNNSTTVISTSIDQPPVAAADAATLLEDAVSGTINVGANDTDVDGGSYVITAITQPSNGVVVNNGTDLNYEPGSDYCNDGNTTDDFTYTINNVSTAIVAITVTCVNDAPSITVMGDIDATGLVDAQNTEIQVANYVDSIVFGPANESSQGVLGFFPNCGTDPNDVIDTIIVSAQGELTIDFSLNLGVALCQLTMLDNGGTQNSGNNTSNIVDFAVSLTDVIFANGFDTDSGMFKQLEFKLMEQYAITDPLIFNSVNFSVSFAGHQLMLNDQINLSSQQQIIEQWLLTLMTD